MFYCHRINNGLCKCFINLNKYPLNEPNISARKSVYIFPNLHHSDLETQLVLPAQYFKG